MFLGNQLRQIASVWGHSFSTYAKFSEKLTFLNPWYAHIHVSRTCAHQGVRNASFSEKFSVITRWMTPFWQFDLFPACKKHIVIGDIDYIQNTLRNFSLSPPSEYGRLTLWNQSASMFIHKRNIQPL